MIGHRQSDCSNTSLAAAGEKVAKVEGSSGTVPWNSSGPVDKGQAAPETGQAPPATVNGQGP